MRKRYIVLVAIIWISYFLVVQEYRGTVQQLKEQVATQQVQNKNLRDSYTEQTRANNKVIQQVNTLQQQLTIAEQQVQSMKVTGAWYIQSGIATAYSPFDNVSGIEAGANPNKTSIGVKPGPGIIAVDPKKIPYHSKIKVVYPDGHIYEGTAGDTGGALQANRGYQVDIFKQTYKEAVTHGSKNVLILWQPK